VYNEAPGFRPGLRVPSYDVASFLTWPWREEISPLFNLPGVSATQLDIVEKSTGSNGWGPMDSAPHVLGCHLTQARQVRNALDDLASII